MPKNLAEVQAELTRIAARARELVGQALTRGTIDKTQHDAYVRELTETGGATRVLIELELEDADKIARTDLDEQVERVLAQLALIGGARVVPNSTKVTLGAINPATDDGYDEPDFDADDEDAENEDAATEAPAGAGQQVTIAARTRVDSSSLANVGNTRLVKERLEDVLGSLGRQHGIHMVAGSTDYTVNGRDVTITHRATGDVYLASLGNAQVEEALSRLGHLQGVELERGSVRVTV